MYYWLRLDLIQSIIPTRYACIWYLFRKHVFIKFFLMVNKNPFPYTISHFCKDRIVIKKDRSTKTMGVERKPVCLLLTDDKKPIAWYYHIQFSSYINYLITFREILPLLLKEYIEFSVYDSEVISFSLSCSAIYTEESFILSTYRTNHISYCWLDNIFDPLYLEFSWFIFNFLIRYRSIKILIYWQVSHLYCRKQSCSSIAINQRHNVELTFWCLALSDPLAQSVPWLCFIDRNICKLTSHSAIYYSFFYICFARIVHTGIIFRSSHEPESLT